MFFIKFIAFYIGPNVHMQWANLLYLRCGYVIVIEEEKESEDDNNEYNSTKIWWNKRSNRRRP